MEEKVKAIILDIVRDQLEELHEGDDSSEIQNLDEDSILFGEDGLLDSMGLVSVIVAVEQAIQDECSTGVALADEKALSAKSSPYRTVKTLAAYASSQIEDSTA